MSDYMNDLVETALDIAKLQHQAIMEGHIPENPDLHKYVEEYLATYFNPESADEQAGPELEP
jgi:hypothetical protein